MSASPQQILDTVVELTKKTEELKIMQLSIMTNIASISNTLTTISNNANANKTPVGQSSSSTSSPAKSSSKVTNSDHLTQIWNQEVMPLATAAEKQNRVNELMAESLIPSKLADAQKSISPFTSDPASTFYAFADQYSKDPTNKKDTNNPVQRIIAEWSKHMNKSGKESANIGDLKEKFFAKYCGQVNTPAPALTAVSENINTTATPTAVATANPAPSSSGTASTGWGDF